MNPLIWTFSVFLTVHFYIFFLQILGKISFLSYIQYKHKYRAAWHGTTNLKLYFLCGKLEHRGKNKNRKFFPWTLIQNPDLDPFGEFPDPRSGSV